MTLTRSWIPLLAVALSLAVHRPARADGTRAAEQYRAAEDAYRHGAYRAAAETFEAAFHEDPRAATIYNAGISWESAGEATRAADDYTVALERSDLPESQRGDASRRVAELERRIGKLDATGPSAVRVAVAHVSDAHLPAHVHLGAGSYTLTATFPDGHVETRPVTITAGASTSVDFPPLPVEPPPVAPPAEPPIVPPAKGPTDGDSSSTTRTAAWITLGASAAFAGTAVVLGLGTLSARDAFDASGDTSASQRDQALTLRTWTNVAWVAAGAAAVTGVVLFVLPSGSQRGAGTAEIRALPGGLSVNGHY